MIPAEREPHAGEPTCGAAHHPLLGRCTLPDHHEGPHVGGSGQYWHEPKFRSLMHRVVELESTVARLEAERDRLREERDSLLASEEAMARELSALAVKTELTTMVDRNALLLRLAVDQAALAAGGMRLIDFQLSDVREQYQRVYDKITGVDEARARAGLMAAIARTTQVTTPLGVPPAHDPPGAT